MIKNFDEFLNEVYDGDSGWAKRGHGGYGYMSGGSISGGWDKKPEPPKNTPTEIAESHKDWLERCKKHGVFVIKGTEYYLESTNSDGSIAYFTQKDWTDNFDPTGCDSIAHMFEMVGSALKDKSGKINDYRSVDLPFKDDNGKEVPAHPLR